MEECNPFIASTHFICSPAAVDDTCVFGAASSSLCALVSQAYSNWNTSLDALKCGEGSAHTQSIPLPFRGACLAACEITGLVGVASALETRPHREGDWGHNRSGVINLWACGEKSSLSSPAPTSTDGSQLQHVLELEIDFGSRPCTHLVLHRWLLICGCQDRLQIIQLNVEKLSPPTNEKPSPPAHAQKVPMADECTRPEQDQAPASFNYSRDHTSATVTDCDIVDESDAIFIDFDEDDRAYECTEDGGCLVEIADASFSEVKVIQDVAVEARPSYTEDTTVRPHLAAFGPSEVATDGTRGESVTPVGGNAPPHLRSSTPTAEAFKRRANRWLHSDSDTMPSPGQGGKISLGGASETCQTDGEECNTTTSAGFESSQKSDTKYQCGAKYGLAPRPIQMTDFKATINSSAGYVFSGRLPTDQVLEVRLDGTEAEDATNFCAGAVGASKVPSGNDEREAGRCGRNRDSRFLGKHERGLMRGTLEEGHEDQIYMNLSRIDDASTNFGRDIADGNHDEGAGAGDRVSRRRRMPRGQQHALYCIFDSYQHAGELFAASLRPVAGIESADADLVDICIMLDSHSILCPFGDADRLTPLCLRVVVSFATFARVYFVRSSQRKPNAATCHLVQTITFDAGDVGGAGARAAATLAAPVVSIAAAGAGAPVVAALDTSGRLQLWSVWHPRGWDELIRAHGDSEDLWPAPLLLAVQPLGVSTGDRRWQWRLETAVSSGCLVVVPSKRSRAAAAAARKSQTFFGGGWWCGSAGPQCGYRAEEFELQSIRAGTAGAVGSLALTVAAAAAAALREESKAKAARAVQLAASVAETAADAGAAALVVASEAVERAEQAATSSTSGIGSWSGVLVLNFREGCLSLFKELLENESGTATVDATEPVSLHQLVCIYMHLHALQSQTRGEHYQQSLSSLLSKCVEVFRESFSVDISSEVNSSASTDNDGAKKKREEPGRVLLPEEQDLEKERDAAAAEQGVVAGLEECMSKALANAAGADGEEQESIHRCAAEGLEYSRKYCMERGDWKDVLSFLYARTAASTAEVEADARLGTQPAQEGGDAAAMETCVYEQCFTYVLDLLATKMQIDDLLAIIPEAASAAFVLPFIEKCLAFGA